MSAGTLLYRTFVYLDSVDPDIDDSVGAGRINVNLMNDIPGSVHSSVLVSVHSMDVPVPNTSTDLIPHKIRVKCSNPTSAQSDSSYNDCLLQMYTAMHCIPLPGDFSVISYRDVDGTSTPLQLLDNQLSNLALYITDGYDRPYVPPRPFDIVLKVELHRNYLAELLEQINKVVAGQELLLIRQDLQNPLHDTDQERKLTYLAPADIYGPADQPIDQD